MVNKTTRPKSKTGYPPLLSGFEWAKGIARVFHKEADGSTAFGQFLRRTEKPRLA